MRPPVPLHGINGRLRKHITKLGAIHAVGIWPPKRKECVADDKLFRELLDSGQITWDKLQEIMAQYQQNLKQFSWLDAFSDQVLDRADDVFWALYGRDPKECEWYSNSEYHRICQNLKRDWHCYNSDLEKLQLGHKPSIATATQQSSPHMGKLIKPAKRWGALGFGLVGFLLFFALMGAANLAGAALVGVATLVLQFFCLTPFYRCSSCGKGYGSNPPSICKRCGIKLSK